MTKAQRIEKDAATILKAVALVRQLGNIAGDRGLRADVLSGMRPHEAATMQKLCDDAAAFLARLDKEGR